MSTRHVLCLNTGSSSVKAAWFRDGDRGPEHVADASVDVDRDDPDGPAAAVDACLDELASQTGDASAPPDVVAHRIVHGGPELVDHAVLTPAVRAAIEDARRFAPLHVPAALAAIDAVAGRHPGALAVACLDTAFHHGRAEVARRYALPAWVHDAGITRYGFHGLSCEHVVHAVGAATLGRAVVAHLGSGASVTAVRDGRSVDTTMGLTPAGGIVMGTRAGDLDPGVLVHLAREHGLDADGLDHLVNHEGGLLGVSGTSADVRVLLEARAHDPRAALALDLFAWRARQAIGALTTTLDGLDTLVFTGGIGEHAPAVRAAIVDGLSHLGVEVDAVANDAGARSIHADGSRVAVLVVPADEQAVMARHALALTAG